MKTLVALLVVSFFLAFVFAIWYFFFNIYEVKVLAETNKTFKAGENYSVRIFGINSFGKKIPFGKIESSLEFLSGSNLVQKISRKNGEIKLKLKKGSGKVKFKIKGKYFIAPAVVEFEVK